MSDVNERYLSAFKRIERQLRLLSGATQYKKFNELLTEVAQSNQIVRHVQDRLKHLGNLRNSLSHDPKPLIGPTQHAVEFLEKIADTLDSPPKLTSLFSMSIKTCKPSDSIMVAARMMHDYAFSQIPIVEGENIIGILTSETVVRWLANTTLNDSKFKDVPLSVVMEFKEKDSFFKVLPSEATVFDALHELDEASKARTDLDAILVTDKGTTSEVPLGILTTFDIPRLIESQLNRLL